MCDICVVCEIILENLVEHGRCAACAPPAPHNLLWQFLHSLAVLVCSGKGELICTVQYCSSPGASSPMIGFPLARQQPTPTTRAALAREFPQRFTASRSILLQVAPKLSVSGTTQGTTPKNKRSPPIWPYLSCLVFGPRILYSNFQ
jgi:hypothetical protein